MPSGLDAQIKVTHHARAARRVRLDVSGLSGNELLARRLERWMSAQDGVESVRADQRSGRVLIVYQPGAALFTRTEVGRPIDWPTASSFQPADGAVHQDRRAPPAPRRVSRAREEKELPWHAWPVAEVLDRLGSGAGGLTAGEIARRLAHHGRNEMEEPTRQDWYAILGRQLANMPTGLLLGSAALSLVLGDVLEAAAIVAVVGLDAAIGYQVERRSEALLASLRKLEAGTVQVVRDGQIQTVTAAELVPGDVMICSPGSVLAADGRVVESDQLSCDEAPLTGESEARSKGTDPISQDAPLAERSSMVYAGTAVATGRGRAVVTATGWTTELAHVRTLLEESRAPKAPLEKRLSELADRASYISLGAASVAAAAGIVRGQPALGVLRSAVALGVAAIPEGLPLISTAALVTSMGRLRRSGIVVRRVSSAETLGGVTVICADKTGTLTENQMKLELIDLLGGPVAAKDLRASSGDPLADVQTLALAGAVLNSEIDLQQNGHDMAVSGSATERALVAAASEAGLDVAALWAAFPRLVLRERQEGVHYVRSLHDAPEGGRVGFVKGAPEQVLELCASTVHGPLTDATREQILSRNRELASRGLRVLAIAWRRLDGDTEKAPREGFIHVALLAMRDPLRPTARDTVRKAARAGIRTVILTGDQSATAVAIARQLGLADNVVEGAAMADLLQHDRASARKKLKEVSVFSRVTPSQKLLIVAALREDGEVVAMAGDGVNDAPALKAADVGIAVGRRSADLARQTADVVLDGEDLESILSAVEEGRIVQDNLGHAVRFLFATNLSEVALMVGYSLFGMYPLNALQLLWINLLTDTLPALALALEPGDPHVIDRPPATTGRSFLDRRGGWEMARDGALLAGVGALAQAVAGPGAVFAALPAAQLGYTPVCRAADGQVALAPASSRFSTLLGASLALHAAALVAPPLRAVLRGPPVSPAALVATAAVGLPWLVSRWGRRLLVQSGPKQSSRRLLPSVQPIPKES